MNKNKEQNTITQQAIASAIRAINNNQQTDNNDNLEISFSHYLKTGRISGKHHIALPKVTNYSADFAEFRALRGESDILALWFFHHQQDSFRKHIPSNNINPEIAIKYYHSLENSRIAAISALSYQGNGYNINQFLTRKHSHHSFRNFIQQQNDIHHPELLSELLYLAYFYQQTELTPAAATNNILVKFSSELFDEFLGEVNNNLWQELLCNINNAEIFYKISSELCTKLVTEQFSHAQNDNKRQQQDDHQTENHDGKSNHNQQQPDLNDNSANQDQSEQMSQETSSNPNASEQPQNDSGKTKAFDEQKIFSRAESLNANQDDNQEQDEQPQNAEYYGGSNSNNIDSIAESCGYRIYTSRFDEVISAAELAKNDEQQNLRRRLDEFMSNSDLGRVHLLAARLQRILMAKSQAQDQFFLEEGMLDSRALPRLIINPLERHIFRQQNEANFGDSIVCLLMDNSGSMRGRPISLAATTADILAKSLEKVGIKCEILGYTTCDWRGGQARKEWSKDGAPARPGRLNDLRHIIYKNANDSYRASRHNIAMMLKEGILKENIDGEALLWAHERLKSRPEHRKILMVISDGAPVDDSTSSANDNGLLDRHLRAVINYLEAGNRITSTANDRKIGGKGHRRAAQSGYYSHSHSQHSNNIELYAIGIGHNVSRYYSNALMIANADGLADSLFGQMETLFG